MKFIVEEVEFSSAGQNVRGTFVIPKNTQKVYPGVIFFHGLTSSEAGYLPMAKKLAARNIAGMTLNIRGHGTSDGNFNELTVRNAVQDGLQAYDFFAKQKFVDRARIGLCGSSVGAAIAALVSEQRPVKSLLLRVPATYTEKMMGTSFKEIVVQEEQIFETITDPIKTPAVRAMERFKGSLLIVTSENDLIIPAGIPESYFLAAKNVLRKEKLVMKGAEHSLSGRWKAQFTRNMEQWFTETV